MVAAVPCDAPRGLRVMVAALSATLAWVGTAGAHAGFEVLEEAVRERVAARPDDPESHLARARVHQIAREWDAALTALAEAAARGADPAVVGAARGLVLLDAGRPRLAKREFDRVLARRPDAHGILFDRGRACLALGRPDQAARDFGYAIAGMPEPRPEHVIARRDALLALGRPDEALRALDEGALRVGAVASLELAAVDLEVELGRHEAALERLDRLLAQGPTNEAWRVRRAEILERAGRPAEARAEYARALAFLDARPARRRGSPSERLRRRLVAALAAPTREDR
jgi:Flp pilus assembly protein TadD